MQLKHISIFLIFAFNIESSYAAIPYDIMKSCQTQKSLNHDIRVTNLNSGGYSDIGMSNCEEQYQMEFEKNIFGSISCGDHFYFLINNQKIDPQSAVDVLKNPEQKPDYIVPHISQWLKIEKNGQRYLCIASPVAENGAAAAYWQYYIIENAFDSSSPINLYYYFFGFKKNNIPFL